MELITLILEEHVMYQVVFDVNAEGPLSFRQREGRVSLRNSTEKVLGL